MSIQSHPCTDYPTFCLTLEINKFKKKTKKVDKINNSKNSCETFYF